MQTLTHFVQKLKVACKLQEEVDDVCQGTVQEKSG